MSGRCHPAELVTRQRFQASPPAVADFIDAVWLSDYDDRHRFGALISGVGGDNVFMQGLAGYGFADQCYSRDFSSHFFEALISSSVHRKVWFGRVLYDGLKTAAFRPESYALSIAVLFGWREGLREEWRGAISEPENFFYDGYRGLANLPIGKALQIMTSCFVPTEYYPYFGEHEYDRFDFFLTQPIVECVLKISTCIHGYKGVDRFLERQIAKKYIAGDLAFRHSKGSPQSVYTEFMIEHRDELLGFVKNGFLQEKRFFADSFLSAIFDKDKLPRGDYSHAAFQVCAWEGWARNWA